MNYFNIIRKLRKGTPDHAKTVKAMKVLGWVCIVVGVWNFIFIFLFSGKGFSISVLDSYLFWALMSIFIIALLFFYASHCLKNNEEIGIRIGQIGIILLLAAIIAMFSILFNIDRLFNEKNPIGNIFPVLVSAIITVQLAIPAFFGVKYIGRLRLKGKGPYSGYPDYNYESGGLSETYAVKYKEALLPFGIHGTFFLILAVPLLGIFAAQRFLGFEFLPFLFLPIFLIIFFGPIIYNSMESSFQKGRKIIHSYTGGGSIFLFQGTWPFFKLIIYEDGLEIRVMLHRFFIPYNKLESIEKKRSIFSGGVYIQSNLPGVPSGIRFYGFGNTGIIDKIKDARTAWLKEE